MPSRRPITDARAYGKFGKHLRWKIIEAAYNYGWSAQEIADWLNRHPSRRFISRASVYRVLQRFDATGDVRTPRGGERRREGRLTREDWALLSDALDADPALYLDEMQALLKLTYDRHYPISTLCQALQRKGYSRVVLNRMNVRRIKAEEDLFRMCYEGFPGSFFVFVDESACEPAKEVRRRGRGFRGSNPTDLDKWSRGKRLCATCFMNIEGMLDFAISHSSGVDSDEFVEVISTYLLPHLEAFPGPNSIVVLDNAEQHWDPRVRMLIEGVGARLVFLPAYAPVLNPIEEAFAQVKNWLRRHREAVAQNAGVALIRAIRTVGNEHAGAYMRHAGYNVVEVLPGVFVDPE